MAESPIFITGLPRTGKTALRCALDAHPRLSLTRKSNLWKSFYGRYGDLGDPSALERCLADLLLDSDVARLQPDAALIRRRLSTRTPTYPELFGIIHSEHARRTGKVRWGEQAHYLDRYVDPIFATWPDARMIHLVRHPAGWMAARSQRRPGGLGRELVKWAGSARSALSNQDRFDGRYSVVTFERLRAQPDVVLGEIAVFIGEEVQAGMADTLVAHLPDDPGSKLGSEGRRYVEATAGGLARQLGYACSEVTAPSRGPSRLMAELWFGPRGIRSSPL